MKKRLAVFALAAVAAFGVTGLASCGGTKDSTSTVAASDLDVCLNYYTNGQSTGITYQGSSAYTNLDGLTYSKGDLLPTWKAFGEALNINFRDVADYSKTDNNAQHSAIYTTPASGTKFVTSSGAKVDIYFNSAANMTSAATDGNLIALSDHLDSMPNLKAFFEANASTYKQLKQADGKVYIAPYFDGKDTIEKMFIMNTEFVEKLLDEATPSYDTTTTITTAYNAYINYGANEKIAVVGTDGAASEITVNVAKNIITTQNALQTKNGATLTDALKTYLTTTYGSYVGTGKLYSKLSEIYTSASACYNVDELIALMRCVKANPTYLTGGSTVNVLFPRQTNANNRVENIMQFASAWGVQGLCGEKDRLYFDKDGNLCDARTTEKSYTAMGYLHDIYTEGLIVSDFCSSTTTKYSEVSFTANTGFMVYDYNATNTVYNATDSNGNGTAGSKATKIRPVLAPVTVWANDDHSKYNFTRYTEDSRAVKSGGWCIPSNTDNLDGALRLFDYIFTAEGANLQDYGPSAFTDGTLTVAGATYAKINTNVFYRIAASGLGWNNWYRIYVGSTQGLGHVRSNGLDYQVTQMSGREGLANVQTAIAAGVMGCALSSNAAGFKACVPTFYSLTTAEVTAAEANISTLTSFWKQQKGEAGQNKVIKNGYASGELDSYKALFTTSNNEYLGAYKRVI